MTPQTALIRQSHGNAQIVGVPVQLNNEIDIFKLGEVFAKSGYFTDAKDASQAIVKMIAGRELGLGAMASMTAFHVVQGKPVMSANAIASKIKSKGSGYNYRVLEMTETVCEIEFFEGSQSIGKSKFTVEEAQTAGLYGKDIWKKYPKNMLFARAISNGARWFCPDIFNGATVYTPEELDAEVDGDGEFIAQPRPASKPQLAGAAKTETVTQNLSPEEKELAAKLNELYVLQGFDNNNLVIAKFNALPTWEEKEVAFLKVLANTEEKLRAQIKSAISDESFPYDEIGTLSRNLRNYRY